MLAIPLVMLSLLATYATLGIAGLPHGWKIAEYVVQTIIIALVATFVASRRKKGAFVAPAG